MIVVSLVATVAYYLLLVYFFTMWARFILDLARNFARNWRPRGFLLIISEIVYTLTDPPIRTARRIVKPIRFGGMSLDFAWSIVMLLVIVLIYLTLVASQV
ncbi:MAG: YggT family protein [Actinomycetota bacterium]